LSRKALRIGKQVANVVYLLAMAAVIVGVDFAFIAAYVGVSAVMR
jgi:hypothetical protein